MTRPARLLLATLAVLPLAVAAQAPESRSLLEEGQPRALWSGAAPGSAGWSLPEERFEQGGRTLLRNVREPTLTPFYPAAGKASGAAVIYCAGGGFRTLPDPTVKDDTIQALLDAGLTVIVLKYRTMQNTPEEQAYQRTVLSGPVDAERINRDLAGDYMKPARRIAADDGRQAVRVVREHAADYGVRPDRIGMIGFSSGGVLDVTVALEHDAQSRPDFIATIYGSPPDAAFTLPADAPPHYIATAANDPLTWGGSLLRFGEWNKAGKPVELHIYGTGGHGFRGGTADATVRRWTKDFIDWLVQEKFISRGRT